MQGLANVTNGIAGLSNAAGDRHGLIDGVEIDDPAVAGFALNAAGSVGLFFIEIHLLNPINGDVTALVTDSVPNPGHADLPRKA